MQTEKEPKLSGQFLTVDDGAVINLSSVTSMWRDKAGLFGRGDDRLRFSFCGEDYKRPMDDDRITALFNKLVDDGSFIAIGDELINTSTLQSLWYDSGKLYYQQAGDDGSVRMPQNEAEQIFDKLLEQKKFMRIADEVVNMNKVVNAWFEEAGWLSSDKLRLNFIGDSSTTIYVDERQAKAAMDQFAKRPHFAEIGGEIVNVAMAGNVWLSGKKLHISYPGTSCTIRMGSETGRHLYDVFDEKFGFHEVGDELLNGNMVSSADATKGGWFSSDRVRYKILRDYGSISENYKDAQSLVDSFAAQDNYVEIEGDVLNINSLSSIYYDGKKLRIAQGTETESWRMDQLAAEEIIAKVLKDEKFVEMDGGAYNIEMAVEYSYEDGALHMNIGRDTEEIQMSPQQAEKILDIIRDYGMKRHEESLKRRTDINEVEADAVWSPDMLADLYAEIAREQNQAMMNAAVVLTVINASNTTTSTIN